MCRWIAYSGAPIYLNELLFKPKHSLIDQSLEARHGETTTNGDGFGVGWYGTGATPGLYKAVQPAWSDENLSNLAVADQIANVHGSRALHDRNGGPAHELSSLSPRAMAVPAQRSHPRVSNASSVISCSPSRPICSPEISGNTDSEIMFYLALTFGLSDDPIAGVQRMIRFIEGVGRKHGVVIPCR